MKVGRKRKKAKIAIQPEPRTTLKDLTSRIRFRKLREAVAFWRTASFERYQRHIELKRWVWDKWQSFTKQHKKRRQNDMLHRMFLLWKDPDSYSMYVSLGTQPKDMRMSCFPGSMKPYMVQAKLTAREEEQEYLRRVNINRSKLGLEQL